MRLVANVGDFGPAYAAALKEAGFTGVYHIHRLREGTDTNARPQARIRTMDAVRGAGLELYYCVEPIGPEHTHQELVDEMLRIRDYPVGVMAVMSALPCPVRRWARRARYRPRSLPRSAPLPRSPPGRRALCAYMSRMSFA